MLHVVSSNDHLPYTNATPYVPLHLANQFIYILTFAANVQDCAQQTVTNIFLDLHDI